MTRKNWKAVFCRRNVILFILAVLSAGFYYSSMYFRTKHEEQVKISAKHTEAMALESQRVTAAERSIWHSMKNAKTLADLEALQKELPTLSVEDQKTARVVVASKIFEYYFWKVERLLVRSRALMEQDEHHPVAKEYLKEAQKIYGKLDGFIAGLGELPGNQEFNFRLYYLKGAFYYRSIVVFLDLDKDKTKVEDFAAKALENWSKALEIRRKDWDTQVAIEVLQKKTKAALSNSGDNPAKLRLQLMPSRDKEISGPFAIGERKQGRY